MTETQAKQTFCPLWMIAATMTICTPKGSKLSHQEFGKAANCVGSNCMMWRTYQQGGADGYCGLAGK